VFCLVGRIVLVRGLRPVPPCFCSVGGGAPVGGAVRAESASLCVVETWGLSPRTPVEAVQGCASPVGVDARQHMGSSVIVDK